MSFINPMLASPMSKLKSIDVRPGEWAAEEKWNGIRWVAEVKEGRDDLLSDRSVVVWSRYGNVQPMPLHMKQALSQLPIGIYDGEGISFDEQRSYRVKKKTKASSLVFVVFDMLELDGTSLVKESYIKRRSILINETKLKIQTGTVRIAASWTINSFDQINEIAKGIWARDGEGVIIKKRTAPYEIGRRSKFWIKLKDLKTAVLKVVELLPTTGEILDRGPAARVRLEDEEGNGCDVKTLNDALCAEGAEHLRKHGWGPKNPWYHRELRIEFAERTPDGGYFHPRWDRWEDE